jgi:hypothetical protein
VAWGVVWGAITAAIPLAVWWLDAANVHALAITLIAAVYIGFARAACLGPRRSFARHATVAALGSTSQTDGRHGHFDPQFPWRPR